MLIGCPQTYGSILFSYFISSKKGGLDIEDVQLKNVDSGCDLDNLIELPYLNEPEILQSLSTRYFERNTLRNGVHIEGPSDIS